MGEIVHDDDDHILNEALKQGMSPEELAVFECRCSERRDAIQRAMKAKLNNDNETWAKEMAFVKKTVTEDIKNMQERLTRSTQKQGQDK